MGMRGGEQTSAFLSALVLLDVFFWMFVQRRVGDAKEYDTQ